MRFCGILASRDMKVAFDKCSLEFNNPSVEPLSLTKACTGHDTFYSLIYRSQVSNTEINSGLVDDLALVVIKICLNHSHMILLLSFSERVLLNSKVLVIVCKIFKELLLIRILFALILPINFGGLYATNDAKLIAIYNLCVTHLCIGVPSLKDSLVFVELWYF